MPQTKEKQKERRKQAAIAAGREYVEHKPTGIEAKDPTEWRREYKRMQRRKQGAAIRAELTAKAQTEREAKAAKRASKEAIEIHDGHVRRYKTLMKSRLNAREYYKKHAVEERQKKSQYKAGLPDSYVVYNLKRGGMPDTAITEKVIELKREAMECTRLMRMLKTAIKNDWKETNETIEQHS